MRTTEAAQVLSLPEAEERQQPVQAMRPETAVRVLAERQMAAAQTAGSASMPEAAGEASREE